MPSIEDLQIAITKFFASTPTERRNELEPLLRRIRFETTARGIETLERPSQSRVHDAANQVIGLPVKLGSGDTLGPVWVGGYTVILLSDTGIIEAAVRAVQGEVYRVFGQDLYPFALAKAVLEEYLRQEGCRGGVLGNYSWLCQILRDHTLISVGSSACYTPASIGVSGAEATDEYRRPFAPGMWPDSDMAKVNFAAGAADTLFATGLAQVLGHTGKDDLPHITEPMLVGIGRLIH
jgi:hypothetical protein